MKKYLKIVGIIAAVIIVLVAGLTLFVRSYLTDERIRVLVTGAAERSLNRTVSLGSVSVSILSGITVRDFEVKEKDSQEAFIRTKGFVLRYRLLPILAKRLVIDELRFVEPRILLTRHADGSFNFSDIGGEDQKKKAEKPSEDSGLPVTMSVRSIVIQKGVVEYRDAAGGVKKATIAAEADLGLTSSSNDALLSEGKLDVVIREIILKEAEKPLTDISLKASYKAEADLAAKKLVIHSLDAEAMKIPVGIRGDVAYAEPMAFSITVTTPDVDLASLKDVSSRFLPAGMSVGGVVSMNLTATKKAEKEAKPVFNGKLLLKEVAIRHKGMQPVLNGAIAFVPERISLENFTLRTGDSSAGISGRIDNYSTFPDMRLDLKSRQLNLDALVPPPAAARQGQQTAAAKAQEKEFEPMKLKLRAAGTVDVEKALFRGMTIQNLKAAYDLKDNIFRISSFSGNTLSGSFSGQTMVDLSRRGTRYTVNTMISGVRIEEGLKAFAPTAKDTLSGTLHGKADIAGAGTVAAAAKQNLQGKGNFSIKDGAFRNAQTASTLLAFLGLQDMKEIRMDRADGNFTITNGIVNLTSLIENKDMIIDEKGRIGLPDESLDIGLNVKVSERLTPRVLAQPSLSGILSEGKGWTSIPLRLGGTISRPSYSLDAQAIGKRATEKVQKRVEEELFKALSGDKKKSDARQPSQDQQQPQQKKNIFQDIFGR